MKNFLSFPIILSVALGMSFTLHSKIAKSAEYEEMTYDELVNRLQKKKNKPLETNRDSLEDIQLHAGFGLINSVNTIEINDIKKSKDQAGFQISFGIDLFSPYFLCETTLRNYENAMIGSQTRNLRELELKVLHRDLFSPQLGYRLGLGISNRSIRISDPQQNIYLTETSPAGLLVFGMEALLTKNLSFGLDLNQKWALVTRTADKQALDFTMRMDTHF